MALGDAHQVDVGKAALGQVSFDGHAVVADLDLCPRRKGARGRIGGGRRGTVRLLVRNGGGGSVAGGGHCGRCEACCGAGAAGEMLASVHVGRFRGGIPNDRVDGGCSVI